MTKKRLETLPLMWCWTSIYWWSLHRLRLQRLLRASSYPYPEAQRAIFPYKAAKGRSTRICFCFNKMKWKNYRFLSTMFFKHNAFTFLSCPLMNNSGLCRGSITNSFRVSFTFSNAPMSSKVTPISPGGMTSERSFFSNSLSVTTSWNVRIHFLMWNSAENI